MTRLDSPPTGEHDRDVQALIEEARRHQQRRRRWIAGLVVSVLLGAGFYAIGENFSGSQPVGPRPEPSQAFHLAPAGPPLGLATAYQLTGPLGVALDPLGDIYLTDWDFVFRVDHTTGQIAVVAGRGRATRGHSFGGDGGLAIRAQLFGPSGVAVAPNGNFYVLDGNYRIRKVTASTDVITTFAGNGRPGSSGDGGPAVAARIDPSAIALAPNGDLYFAEANNNVIRKVSRSSGIITTVAGDGKRGSVGDGGLALDARLDHPTAITFDHHGDLLLATWSGIREVSASSGVITTVVRLPSSEGFGWPNALGVSPSGELLYFTSGYGRHVLALDFATHRLRVIAGTGVQTVQRPGANAGDGGTALKATFGLPAGLAVDPGGNLFIADFFNNSIRSLNSGTGVIDIVAGQIPQSPAHCC